MVKKKLSKLLSLLLSIMEVISKHKKWPKIGTNIVKRSFFSPRGKKSLGQRPKLSAGARSKPRSGLYLLVFIKH